MRRLGLLVVAAGIAAASFVGLAGAAAPPSVRVEACVTGPGYLLLVTRWRNEAPVGTQTDLQLNFTLTASDPSLSQSYVGFIGKVASPNGTFPVGLAPYQSANGPIPWDDFTSVSVALASAPFFPDSDSVAKPKSGWKPCKGA